MNFPWPRIWSIACPTFPASATKAMPHTRSASSSGTRPAIPAKSNEAPVACPSWIYNNRNRVERLWARLKEWRAPLRENRQILHGRPLPCRHLRLDQERLQAITGPNDMRKGRYLRARPFRMCNSASERLSSSMLCTSVSTVPCLIDVSFSLACWTVLHDRDLVRQD